MYFILNYSFIEATLNTRCDAKMSSFLKKKKKTISLLNNKYPKMLLGCDMFEVSLMSSAFDFYKE